MGFGRDLPRVEETHSRLSSSKKSVIDKSKDGGNSWGRGGSTTDSNVGTVPHVDVVGSLGGEVGVGSSLGVVQAGEGAVEVLDVVLDYSVLVLGAGEVITETSTSGVS